MLRKYKNEIFAFMISLLLLVINGYYYIDQALLTPVFPTKGLNAFSFWYYVRTVNIGEILLFLTPIFIVLFSISKFYSELSSGIYQHMILKSSYRKYFFKSFLKIYAKAILYIVSLSIITFLVGFFMFGDQIIYTNTIHMVLRLPNFGTLNPYIFFLLSIIFHCMFSIIVVNIALIVLTKVKKYYIVLIASFLVFMILNYGVYFLLFIFSNMINVDFNHLVESINLFQGYIPEIDYQITFVSLLFWFVISIIGVNITYHKRQKVIDFYES